MECDSISETGDVLSDPMSESTVAERLEVLMERVTQLMEKLLADKDANEREGLHAELLADMDEVATLMNTSDSENLLSMAKFLMNPSFSRLEVIYSFLHECFVANINESENLFVGGHLSCLLNCIVGWTNISKELRCKVIHDGHLFLHIEQLAQLAGDGENEVFLVGNTVGIIWNCLQDNIRPYHYSVMWVELLEPWMKCSYPEIRLQCKFILGQLSLDCTVIPHDSSSLVLDEEDMTLLFSLLDSAIHSPELIVQQFGWEYSALELIIGIECISSNPKNLARILNFEISSLLSELLQKMDVMGKIQVCKLFWTLMDLSMSYSKSSFNIDFIKDLESDKDSNLKILSTSLGIASALKSTSSLDMGLGSAKCLTYMQGCHLTKRYKESINFCNTYMAIFQDPKDLERAILLKAKALYNVYIDEQMILHENSDTMSAKDISRKVEECYGKVKELIILLGNFIDNPACEVKDEVHMMLDSAMMDYIHETNKLHEIQQCYLCYKKLANEASPNQDGVISHAIDVVPHVTKMYKDLTIQSVHEEENSVLMETSERHHPQNAELEGHLASARDKCAQKRGPLTSPTYTDAELTTKKVKCLVASNSKICNQSVTKKNKLIRSHLFPKAILERFAHAVPLPNDARVILSHMPGLAMKRKYKHHLVSPRKSTLFMLCPACENTLSTHGETQFLPQFFDKLYDTRNPSKSTSEQVIKYSDELYNFCIGMIFRTLYWSKGKYTNEDELYMLLQKCRQYLLNVQSGSLPNSEDMPDVFILISPLSAEESELRHGFMNTVLSGMCLGIVANSSLSTGEISPKITLQAQYFLIHIGAINILIKLAPSKDIKIPMKYCISPQGGNYHVPHESARMGHLPHGIWCLFQLLAQMNQKQWLEASENRYWSFKNKDVNQPTASVASAYGITAGHDIELDNLSKVHLQPSPDPNIPKVINFLPDQFFVRPYQLKTLELPPNHKLLLHETAGDNLSGNTIFIAVGIEDCSQRPYIIWHYYNQGIQINFGFFIERSDDGIKVGEFLVSTKEKFRIEDFPEVMQTRKNASNILPGVLQAKGFFNLQSLLNKVNILRKNLSVIDLRCSIVNDSQCWYCEDLCDSCLERVQPLITEAVSMGEQSGELKLCSENCRKICETLGADSSQQVYIITSDGNIRSTCSGKQLGQKELHKYCGLRCAPILPDHQEILHLYSIKFTSCLLSIQEISLCCGDINGQDCRYVVYCKRGLFEQLISLEFFISKNFEPTQLLPYFDLQDKAASEAFDELKASIDLQHLLTTHSMK